MAEKNEPQEVAVKNKQVAVALTPDEFAEFDKQSWARKHRKLSEALRESVAVWSKMTPEQIEKILGA